MNATGIGASVRRKEDLRFITGRGHDTDDITRPGQTHACFVRSPHAHARIKRIDHEDAAGMPGVMAVLTGADLAGDKVGSLICGWAITSTDGTPMKMAPHPAISHEKACHVGDAVAVVIAETFAAARDAAEKVAVDYEVLPAAFIGLAPEHKLRVIAPDVGGGFGSKIAKCLSNPLGIKGCGEAAAIAAPAAVMNAVTDAVGTEDIAVPAPPHTVWAAIEKTTLARKAAE